MKKIISLVLAAALCFSLAACGSSESAAGETPAKKTGEKVTVYMPSPAGLADKLAEGFTAATGIEVEQFQGTTGEILAPLKRKKQTPLQML